MVGGGEFDYMSGAPSSPDHKAAGAYTAHHPRCPPLAVQKNQIKVEAHTNSVDSAAPRDQQRFIIAQGGASQETAHTVEQGVRAHSAGGDSFIAAE